MACPAALRELELGRGYPPCEIQALPPSWCLPGLRELRLYSNELSDLPWQLSALTALTLLHLGHTRLTTLPQARQGCVWWPAWHLPCCVGLPCLRVATDP
jgi:hypothetical protein